MYFISYGGYEKMKMKMDDNVAIVENAIQVGHANALSREYLSKITGMSDRMVRRAIELSTKPIVNKIGVKCPKCNNGDIILRKSKKGKAFYGCSNYPECDFLSWNKQTGDICDKCGSYMIEKITKSETKVVCPNKECKNEMVKENSEN